MANFATFAAAEARAVDKMSDGTWVQAHAAHDKSGDPIVRFQRFMSPTNPDYGAWVETRDDATV